MRRERGGKISKFVIWSANNRRPTITTDINYGGEKDRERETRFGGGFGLSFAVKEIIYRAVCARTMYGVYRYAQVYTYTYRAWYICSAAAAAKDWLVQRQGGWTTKQRAYCTYLYARRYTTTTTPCTSLCVYLYNKRISMRIIVVVVVGID